MSSILTGSSRRNDGTKGKIIKDGYECDNQENIKRFRRYKQQAVDYKGGKCERCGYDKCLGSLDFHHVDPRQKDPDWRKMRNWPLEKVKGELDKCILVCSNCHGEIHYQTTGD